MSKRTVILTQKQLDEIVTGKNTSYFDGDDSLDYANKITTDGNSSKTIMYTDKSAATRPLSNYGTGVASLREANQDLVNKEFGAKDCHPGKSYEATKKEVSRANQAKETMQTGATQDIKNKAAQTLQTMENNIESNNGIDLKTLGGQYINAKNISKRQKRIKKENGESILKSTPKNVGNGKAHSIKTNNGFITYK